MVCNTHDKIDDDHVYRSWRVLTKFKGKHYFYYILTHDVTDVKLTWEGETKYSNSFQHVELCSRFHVGEQNKYFIFIHT
jgi:hypothetical protein